MDWELIRAAVVLFALGSGVWMVAMAMGAAVGALIAKRMS